MAGIHLTDNIFHLAWLIVTSLPRWHPASMATGLAALAAAGVRLPAVPAHFSSWRWNRRLLAFDLPAAWPWLARSICSRCRRCRRNSAGTAPLTGLVRRSCSCCSPAGAPCAPWRCGTATGQAIANSPRSALPISGRPSCRAAGQRQLLGRIASETAGAATRWTAVVGAIGLAVLVVAGAPLVAQLPGPVLAAVVVAALTHALDPVPLLRLWILRRDAFVATGAAAGVLLFGVVPGMLMAIGLSLLVLLQRMATPRIVRLGRLGDGHDYVDIKRHPDATLPEAVAVWRPAEPLFFANAEQILAHISEKLAASRHPYRGRESRRDIRSTPPRSMPYSVRHANERCRS